MARLDHEFLERGDGRYATAVMMTIDAETGAVEYVSAGHLPFLLTGRDGVRTFDANGPPLGLLPDTPRTVSQATLRAPGHIVLVTDGVTERTGPAGDDGIEPVQRLVAAMIAAGAKDVVDRILVANDEFAAGRPTMT